MSEYVSANTEMDASLASESIAAEAGLSSSAGGLACAAVIVVGIGAAIAWLVERASEAARELETAPAAGGVPGLGGVATPRGLEDLRYASALRSALERPQLRLLRASIDAEAASELRGGSEILDRLTRAAPTRDFATEAREARVRLERAVSKGAARQLSAEERLLERAATGALQELGYHVQSRRNPRTGRVALRAQHARKATRVVVDLDAQRQNLAADFAGFSGVACAEERDRLFAALSRRGYKARVAGRFEHAREEGGPLAQEIDRLFAVARQSAAGRPAQSHRTSMKAGS